MKNTRIASVVMATAAVGLVLGLNIAARGGASKSELRGLLQAARRQIESWRRSN